MSEKSHDDMTLRELKKELEFAIDMANIGRDRAWVPVINDLDQRIKTITGEPVCPCDLCCSQD